MKSPAYCNLSKGGFTITELMIVVAIIGLLASIATANLFRVRETAVQKQCISNLRILHQAKQSWALENRRLSASVPGTNDLCGPGLYIRRMPECGSGGTYTMLSVGEPPACNRPGHVLE